MDHPLIDPGICDMSVMITSPQIAGIHLEYFSQHTLTDFATGMSHKQEKNCQERLADVSVQSKFHSLNVDLFSLICLLNQSVIELFTNIL